MNSLERSIINWCSLHPDNPDSQYIIIHESKAKKNAEAKKWRLIATRLEFYELRFIGR
jgi:hypothetical protein